MLDHVENIFNNMPEMLKRLKASVKIVIGG